MKLEKYPQSVQHLSMPMQMPMPGGCGIIPSCPTPSDPFPFRLRYDQVLHANAVVMRMVNAQSNQQVLTDLLNKSAVVVQVSASRLVYG